MKNFLLTLSTLGVIAIGFVIFTTNLYSYEEKASESTSKTDCTQLQADLKACMKTDRYKTKGDMCQAEQDAFDSNCPEETAADCDQLLADFEACKKTDRFSTKGDGCAAELSIFYDNGCTMPCTEGAITNQLVCPDGRTVYRRFRCGIGWEDVMPEEDCPGAEEAPPAEEQPPAEAPPAEEQPPEAEDDRTCPDQIRCAQGRTCYEGRCIPSISSCGPDIQNDTNYSVSGFNIENPSYDCISIRERSNIVIDCGGNSINQQRVIGFQHLVGIYNSENIEFRNCVLDVFLGTGVFLENSRNVRINNVTLQTSEGNAAYGIHVVGGGEITLRDNTIEAGFSTGIQLDSGRQGIPDNSDISLSMVVLSNNTSCGAQGNDLICHQVVDTEFPDGGHFRGSGNRFNTMFGVEEVCSRDANPAMFDDCE